MIGRRRARMRWAARLRCCSVERAQRPQRCVHAFRCGHRVVITFLRAMDCPCQPNRDFPKILKRHRAKCGAPRGIRRLRLDRTTMRFFKKTPEMSYPTEQMRKADPELWNPWGTATR